MFEGLPPRAHRRPPTEGKVWIVGEENLVDAINPDKPKTKLATSKIGLIAGELERVRT